MINPFQERMINRLKELIEEGKLVAKLEKPSSMGHYIQGEDRIPLNAWLTKTDNILQNIFGFQSSQYRSFKDILPTGGQKFVEHSYDIYPIIGVLTGALSDLENGFVIGQEFLIAGKVFDSILEQAKELNDKGYKDPAAVLVRVVIEDALNRLAMREGLSSAQKASQNNDDLKRLGIYPQPQWRFIQAWLDIGNKAAHGEFDQYTKSDVEKIIGEVGIFLATYLIG